MPKPCSPWDVITTKRPDTNHENRIRTVLTIRVVRRFGKQSPGSARTQHSNETRLTPSAGFNMVRTAFHIPLHEHRGVYPSVPRARGRVRAAPWLVGARDRDDARRHAFRPGP